MGGVEDGVASLYNCVRFDESAAAVSFRRTLIQSESPSGTVSKNPASFSNVRRLYSSSENPSFKSVCKSSSDILLLSLGVGFDFKFTVCLY